MPPAATWAPSTTQHGIPWYGFGEIIGVSNADWGSAAADHIYSMWKASAPHAAIMFSRGYNYVGIGFAYRASNGTTWASVVFADSKDHTAPKAERDGKGVSGRTVTFRWRATIGSSRPTWPASPTSTSRSASTTATGGRSGTTRPRPRSRSGTGRAATGTGSGSGRADQRGNLSEWTSEGRVWVP